MAHIVEEPKNVTYNSDDTTFKSEMDSMNIDGVDFSNPAEVKAWAVKVKTLFTKMKSMMERFHGWES